MTISKSRAQLLVILCLLLGFCYLAFGRVSEAFSKAFFYKPTDATIVSKGELCRVYGMTPEAQAVVDQSPDWRRAVWGNCEEANTFANSGISRYHRMGLVTTIKRKVVIVHYRAPADGSRRVAQLHALSWSEVGTPSDLELGAIIKILGHKKDPEKASLM
ncbi:MAG: hypothetical protein CFE32_00875 [Alphaproteobacteria bacterium PA3]|nr:MAG: hypothetical protein CFE32_00875 [Alphaproteobacteria bacterium PA3]